MSRALAKRPQVTGYPEATLSRIENGKVNPHDLTKANIEKALRNRDRRLKKQGSNNHANNKSTSGDSESRVA